MMPRRVSARRRRGVRGSQMLEFALIGIPFIFLILAIVQMSIGMFTYNTLASAVDLGARYASVRPKGSVGSVAKQIVGNSPGLLPGNLSLVMSGTVNGVSANVATCLASSCVSQMGTVFPTGTALADTVTISGTYPFATPLAVFWPAEGVLHLAGTVTLGATTTQLIQ